MIILMFGTLEQSSPGATFWLLIWALMATVVSAYALARAASALRTRKRLTWDMHSDYIDISEFSNRNIPLKITYKGTEPRWLWATYLSLRNTGRQDISSEDAPEKHHIAVGQAGCRYIGFNKLITKKAKVNLSPLFRGNDVYCKVEFDRLGPGDEILASLLFVADERERLEVEGELFGAGSQIVSGYQQRLSAWRGLWWLLLGIVFTGFIGGAYLTAQVVENKAIYTFQMQILIIIYLLALITAGILMRPIKFWQQVPELFSDYTNRQERVVRLLKFLFFLQKEP
jgi:hypothetical protein